MSALSSEQLRLVLLLGTLVGVILAAVFSGLGFLIKRRMTGAAKQERMSYLATVADLAAKARSAGMTVDEVAALERALLSPSTSGSTAAITAVAASTSQTLNPRYANNVAMKARAHAALDVATAQMEQSYLDLALIADEDENVFLEQAQQAWKDYLPRVMSAAGAQYQGGTHAPLAGTLAGIAETERRTEELKSMVREIAARNSTT